MATGISNFSSIEVGFVLPIHDSSIPLELVVGLGRPLPESERLNIPSIHDVGPAGRLAHHQLLGWDAQAGDLIDRGAIEIPRRLHKQAIVGVVLCVSLVVELDVVEVDGAAHLLVDGHVASILVETLLEIWALGSVGDNMVWKVGPELFLELYDPVLAFAGLHCCVVLPIDVHSVEVVCQYERG